MVDKSAQYDGAVAAADQLLNVAIERLRARLCDDAGAVNLFELEKQQHAAHGLAWLAAYVESLRQFAAYRRDLSELGRLGELEALLVEIGFAEYLSQISGGIPMSQGEIVRPATLGVTLEEIERFSRSSAVCAFTDRDYAEKRCRAMALIVQQEGAPSFGDPALDDTLTAFRDEIRRFAMDHITPAAHGWHVANDYIPMAIIERLAELGVFGLTIPEQYGGLGLGKRAMCVVSEELSRAYIGVGSLGTRSEIAAELILSGGTDAQKSYWLPRIASGECLPTAVFTEPNTGSDLASLTTRAERDGDVYRVTGNKSWITHPVRADLMTLLARSEMHEHGYRGLSMFLVEKSRGSDDNPFPMPGMSGSEIEVIGYRGMKEYEISFDQFQVPASSLLGAAPGAGFKQLMRTFESARIQTAARAVGVAQSAMDLALRYAQERVQFGKQLHHFPRVADKIVMMAVEIMIARQLTSFAAQQKDGGHRCDLEAGMAKLLAARVAWAAADNAVQIHGGNGFAVEYPVSRVLCDARILSIFEGAAEIQAQIIARRILAPSP